MRRFVRRKMAGGDDNQSFRLAGVLEGAAHEVERQKIVLGDNDQQRRGGNAIDEAAGGIFEQALD